LRERDETQSARADLLEKASAHWLRHSAGSHMADQKIDLRTVRDNLGHASLTTTSIYLHVDDDRRHQEWPSASSSIGAEKACRAS
jgi:site-specific recombinase XerD